MEAKPIVDVMAELAQDDGRTLVAQHGFQSLAPAQAIQGELVPYLEKNELTNGVWQQFRQSPQTHSGQLALAVGLLLGTNAALNQKLDGLYAQFQKAAGQGGTTINTGGGAYVGGNVSTGGGAFVGRDQIVHGDIVHGDKVAGDKVAGDKIVGMSADDVGKLFAGIYGVIETKSPPQAKPEVTQTVQAIEQEVKKGAAADEGKLEGLLKTLATMSGDIFDVVASCLISPWAGVGTVIRKVVERVKAERK